VLHGGGEKGKKKISKTIRMPVMEVEDGVSKI